MTIEEIEAKLGTKIDTENVLANVRGKYYPATLITATLDESTLKPVLVFDVDIPTTERKPRKPKSDAKAAKK